jgi:hypothetical protein
LFYSIFIPWKGERREKRKGAQGWNCSPIQIIKNDNHTLFYEIFTDLEEKWREKRKNF